MPKSLLIISRQAPWSGPGAREALDIVLAGGAFDLPIGLLFMDDGVFQLLPEQTATELQQKDLTANLKALSLFGIDDIYACGDSLAERGVLPDELTIENLTLLHGPELSATIDRYDQVITL
ncbi:MULTISPECIES: sulfurtransferase complex subunit TusC [unclassified Pseudomonas]|uniref:sulfurtransferase complex subunit TusC n=1 Tax=unclassified Pseudomonas TaxID=196821 RepID=UPI002AC8CF24|nr:MULTISPECIES: sulfurtransferase complex subunit TusC [unclassified Pseudomonas]MEB0042088.1 sulfurtransferase complex subunit TusC [Pseudomonas sp. MH10]MEB0078534.1 sulfurtransferase complex subunit TusC [Pseudomonas sp. MH10out]MEB0092166.1 sulfurtransferase complex subunit TusC [Pseudomonas sp. CCI4.2]MEB0100349.1 sulfurtransferase complex subunit TusC [Pseudomonas sp. CCI3.2]MEB0120272.1 sulfurtransferase complex subunit TusC [Pseudomonas sp. CCI1.2]